jgi:hypothetical protein
MLEHRRLEKVIDTFLAMMEGRGVGRVTLRGSVVLLSSIASLSLQTFHWAFDNTYLI